MRRRVTERCSLKLGSCYFALVVDACLLLFLSQWVSSGWAEVGLILDGFLLFSTAVATASNTSMLLLPNLLARALLLTSMLFFSCFALDALLRPDDPLQILPLARKKVLESPEIAFICSLFCIFIMIEFKLFVQVWRNLQETPSNPDPPPVAEKPPPAYSVCLENDALPTYEDISRSRTASVHRSSDKVIHV